MYKKLYAMLALAFAPLIFTSQKAERAAIEQDSCRSIAAIQVEHAQRRIFGRAALEKDSDDDTDEDESKVGLGNVSQEQKSAAYQSLREMKDLHESFSSALQDDDAEQMLLIQANIAKKIQSLQRNLGIEDNDNALHGIINSAKGLEEK